MLWLRWSFRVLCCRGWEREQTDADGAEAVEREEEEPLVAVEDAAGPPGAALEVALGGLVELDEAARLKFRPTPWPTRRNSSGPLDDQPERTLVGRRGWDCPRISLGAAVAVAVRGHRRRAASGR